MKPSLDDRAIEVYSWLAQRFAEDPTHVAAELEARAKAEGILLGIWWDHPTIRLLDIRPASVEVTPGVTACCWTVIPKGDDES